MHPPIALKWHPLELFDQRFGANVESLRTRDPALAERLSVHTPSTQLFVAAHGDQIFLGRSGSAGIEIVPDPLPPAEARKLLATLFPNNLVSWPLLIGGLAYGWAWDRISKLPCKVETAPGHKPPIYLLTSDFDQLWAVLHVMDWAQLLADPRFVILAGTDAVTDLKQLLTDDLQWSRPRASIRIESALWTGEFNSLMQSINESIDRRTEQLKSHLDHLYPPSSRETWEQKLSKGGRLKILGITSRYTTFLKYSMRDWLAGFERLGHETRLLMEEADHLICAPPAIAAAVADYRPDLIVIIDHCRSETHVIPDTVPCVMYVQDRLPNIFNSATGASQGPLDYVLGFGRLHLSTQHGYPADRFLPAPVGINETRFTRSELSPSALERFACDVSYVGNASRPAADVMREQSRKSNNSQFVRLFEDLYQRMEAWYSAGNQAFSEIALRQQLERSIAAVGIQLDSQSAAEILGFFHQEINNRLYRHQTLQWLADTGVNLHLYGNGWESNQKFARFAKGVADNQRDLPLIYRASKINIQVTPHGCVHQRLLDGLAAGGFFLLRRHPGDRVARLYRELFTWCQNHNITNDADLHSRADDRVTQIISRINQLEGSTLENRMLAVYDVMTAHADSNFTTSADGIWPAYESVAFDNGGELESKLVRFLNDPDSRHDIAQPMRDAVIERFSYTSINRRLFNLMRSHISAERAKCAA
jgi:hypothetical protein